MNRPNLIKEAANEPFLQRVAKDLLQKYGNDLSSITLVFPNKRARLFMNEYLAKLSPNPIWAPFYTDLSGLFQQISALQLADSLKLIADLYASYSRIYLHENGKETPETFDEFYFFGEILLNDFNDLDKNRVNEMALFSNLAELDLLQDNFEHLNENQWELVHRFFKDISENKTPLKDAFYSIWSMLGRVYDDFRKNLKLQGIAYEGMLFRQVVDTLNEENSEALMGKYVFVGFNVLTTCERDFFKQLQQMGKALFYWDFDDYYYKNEQQEAGRFIRENIRTFGNEMKVEKTDLFISTPKKITLVASSSESAQASFVPHWIEEVGLSTNFNKPDSAIVLCNEGMLQSVMHAIPPVVDKVNITMGFPLVQTPIFSLITSLTDLQLKGVDGKHFRYTYVLPVLRNPSIRRIFPEAEDVLQQLIKENNFFPTKKELRNETIFSEATSTIDLANYLLTIVKEVAICYRDKEQDKEKEDMVSSFDDLHEESLFRAFQALSRLLNLLESDNLQLEKATFASLLKRMLSTASIPFHGEPAQGLQVMGLLETRNMDFRNLLMLSVNEGVLPKVDNDSSFIPHFIRKFFGMTTIEHQDSLYAYYFYRLLQRAENIVLMYNSAATDTGKQEMSRFLLQLLTEYPYQIEQISLQSNIAPSEAQTIVVQKTPTLLARIKDKYDLNTNPAARPLSPSALNSFLDCSLRFYFRQVENIKPPQELSDELDNSVLGNVFHRTMEYIYREIGHLPERKNDFPAFMVKAEQIELFLKNDILIKKIIQRAFNKEFFNRETPLDRYNGEQLIYFRITKQFVKRMLRLDLARAPFKVVGLEKEGQYREITVDDKRLKLGGIIDRLDEKDGSLRVVDYKTGGNPKEVANMKQLFTVEKDRANYIFQTFLYSSIMLEKQSEAIVPTLIYIQKAIDENYSPIVKWEKEPINDFRFLAEEFDEYLMSELNKLFDPNIPFSQTNNEKLCEWCDFKGICKRG